MTEESMTEFAYKRMQENEKFLSAHSKHIEIIELMNDAIDFIKDFVKKDTTTNEYIQSSMTFYLGQILLPSSYSMYCCLLLGNIPACFRELRFLLESLGKCSFAEFYYPDEKFFINRMIAYQNELNRDRKGTSKVLNELKEKVDFNLDIQKIYGELSNNWVHTTGFAQKVVDHTINVRLPSWGWILPIDLDETDLSTIDELNGYISDFRIILGKTITHYKNESRRLS